MPVTAHKIKTRVIDCRKKSISHADLEFCTRVIDQGGLVIFPTDTVYGVGCNAFHPAAVKKVYALKGRSYAKPLPILLGHLEQLSLIAADVVPEAMPLIEKYWPGPLTLVLKTAPLALVASRGKNTVAVRVPDHKIAIGILKAAHVPLAVTSANHSGKPEVTKGLDAIDLFEGRVDVIVDGGACDINRASSVVDATHHPFTILREGAISKTALAKALNLA